MNTRFPKDPPSASPAASASSRRSLIRDQVRRRRAAVGIGSSREGGAAATNAADVKTALLSDGRVKTLTVHDESAWQAEPVTHRSLHTTSSTDNYGFDSHVECALDLHGSSSSSNCHSPKHDGFLFQQSPNEHKLWNPSFYSHSDTTDCVTPQRNNRSNDCDAKQPEGGQAHEERMEQQVEWPNDNDEDDESIGFECTFFQSSLLGSRNESDASWSQMHTPGNHADHKETSTKETPSKETATTTANASHRSRNRWDSANVSRAKAIIQQRNQRMIRNNTANRGGVDTPVSAGNTISNNKQLKNDNRTVESPPSTALDDKETQFISTRMKFMMDWTDSKTGASATAKASPQIAPPRVVTPTNQHHHSRERNTARKSRAERKDGAPSFDEGTAVSQRKEHENTSNSPSPQPMQQQPTPQSRLEHKLQRHTPIVSVAVTSSSVFSEDDSLFSNFSHLRLARQQRSANVPKVDVDTNIQGTELKDGNHGATPAVVSPTNVKGEPLKFSNDGMDKNKNDMSLSTVHDTSEESIRDLHVSLDSRDIGRAHDSPRKEKNHHLQAQGGGSHELESPTKVTAKPLDCSHGNSISFVHDTSDESLRDLHVSVDSRDIGRAVPRYQNVENVERDNKSVKSFAAPSFDEAASVRSRTNRAKNDCHAVAKPLDHATDFNSSHRSLPLAGNKLMEWNMLWGGSLLERSDHNTAVVVSCDQPDSEESNYSLGTSAEGDNSVDISKEAEHVLNIRDESDFSLNISREADRVLDSKEISLSMLKLMESAVQEATWSKQAANGSFKRSSTSQKLPPIHPDRLSVGAVNKDERIVTQRRMQYPTRNKNGSVPPLTEFSPTRSDHSADAAAGAMHQLRNLIFDPLSHEPDVQFDISKNHEPTIKHGAPSFQWKLNSFPRSIDKGDKVDHNSGMSVDSWEADIIGSRGASSSPLLVSDQDDNGAGYNTIHDTSSKCGSLSAKLEMLRNSAGVPYPHANNGDDKSSLSGRVSVASIQPSVESDCVRQNADIALLMEDTMMDFMNMEGKAEEELIHHSYLEDEKSTRKDPSEEPGVIPNQSSQPNEPHPNYHLEFSQFQYAPTPPSPPKPILNKVASRHQYFSKKHFPSLLSVDEEEEFSEPSFNASSPLSASPKSSGNSSPRTGGKPLSRKNLLVPTNQKDLGHFLDQFRDNLMTGCAPLKDDDLASSHVFSFETSQFENSFLTTGASAAEGESDVTDEHSDGVTPLPSCGKELTPQERALKRREDTTPLRTNTTRSKRVSTDHSLPSSGSARSQIEENTISAVRYSHNDDANIGNYAEPPIANSSQGDVQMLSKAEAIDSPKVLPDEDVMPSYHSDVVQSYERQGIERNYHTQSKGGLNNKNAGKVNNPDAVNNNSEEVKVVQEAEWGKMSEREKHKSRSLHWNSNNGVNDDEEFTPKFAPTRAKVCARVIAARTSLTSISSSQALIRQHFRESSYVDHNYSPDDEERKLGYIHECSREDDTDSTGDEAVNDYDSPEYEYDDFVRDFSTIVEADSGHSSAGQHEEKSLEFRFVEEEDELLSSQQGKSQVEKYTDGLQNNEFTFSLNEMRSVSTSDQRKDLGEKSPLKPNSLSSRAIEGPTHRSHPHYVPNKLNEVSKTQLEEKLRRIGGINRDGGSSVATSELGSILTRESEISRSCSIPKMIFHRTHPPCRVTDSARSSPSSMCNTYNAPSLMLIAETSQCSGEGAIMMNKTPPRINRLLPDNARLPLESQSITDSNADVFRSQEILRDKVASAASSAAMIDEQLSKLRSRRIEQMRNHVGGEITSISAVPKGCGTQGQLYSPHSSSPVDDTKTQLFGDNQPESVANGVGALRMKYQQFISTTSSDNGRLGSHQKNNSLPSLRQSSNHTKPKQINERQPEVAKISTFWNQLEVSSDSSIDKPCPNIELITKTPNERPTTVAQSYHDDASQASGDAFEIAPRGTGFGVLNKNQWMKDETSSISEDPTVGVLHDVFESLSHNAFEISPLYIPGSNDTAVVAKLPSLSKLHKAQNTSSFFTGNGSPLRRQKSVYQYSSLGSTVSTESLNNVSVGQGGNPKSIGSRVASSPFLKKSSAADPKGDMVSSHQSNQMISSTKNASYHRANVFSNSWKHSPDKKPPTIGNKSVATEKLHARFRSSKKTDSSWIAKQDPKGKKDNSWIVR
ncbi:hypothetical protein HJC23_004912 [Cyclotella cryptica]|uniref:Uncharacterized protein n=1 Tax=Cyclotella cryptica TaxID=29204 RepID=A0ABD3PS17_9STRA|eukprot:CCRYP_011848-RA/>CCRYP_011848-RA protein AED:0.01 eAED:0.01 QI:289/1/1/1/1/1/3/79/2160